MEFLALKFYTYNKNRLTTTVIFKLGSKFLIEIPITILKMNSINRNGSQMTILVLEFYTYNEIDTQLQLFEFREEQI